MTDPGTGPPRGTCSVAGRELIRRGRSTPTTDHTASPSHGLLPARKNRTKCHAPARGTTGELFDYGD